MKDDMKRQIEKFEADYNKIASKDVWEPSDISKMKDLQKLMYYMEVRCAMKDGDRYPGSDYMDRGSYDMHHFYDRGRSNMSYGGRRYYDDERRNAIDRLNHMMDTESNQEVRMAIKDVIRGLEER